MLLPALWKFNRIHCDLLLPALQLRQTGSYYKYTNKTIKPRPLARGGASCCNYYPIMDNEPIFLLMSFRAKSSVLS